ncbi:hypothetical protein T08_3570, partial [Trichinella sp. T8]
LRNSFRCGKCRSIHCVKFRRTGEIQAKNWHYNTRRTVPFKFIKCTGYITCDRRFAKVLFFLCSLNLLGCFCRFALPTFSLLRYESVGGSVRPRCSGSKACQARFDRRGERVDCRFGFFLATHVKVWSVKKTIDILHVFS